MRHIFVPALSPEQHSCSRRGLACCRVMAKRGGDELLDEAGRPPRRNPRACRTLLRHPRHERVQWAKAVSWKKWNCGTGTRVKACMWSLEGMTRSPASSEFMMLPSSWPPLPPVDGQWRSSNKKPGVLGASTWGIRWQEQGNKVTRWQDRKTLPGNHRFTNENLTKSWTMRENHHSRDVRATIRTRWLSMAVCCRTLLDSSFSDEDGEEPPVPEKHITSRIPWISTRFTLFEGSRHISEAAFHIERQPLLT